MDFARETLMKSVAVVGNVCHFNSKKGSNRPYLSLDRATRFEPVGRRFKSFQVRHMVILFPLFHKQLFYRSSRNKNNEQTFVFI